MKTKLLAIFSFVFALSLIGCKKDDDGTIGNLTKRQRLTLKTWRVDKLHHVVSGKYSTYTLGGTNTTGLAYDKMRFTFKDDGTGVHITTDDQPVPFTWEFTTDDQREMKLVVLKATYIWQMVEIEGKYLHGSTQITLGTNSNNLETFRLIQVQ